MSLSETLRELRQSAGLSQADLAKIAGVSRNAVSQWEAGVTQPSTKRLAAIAQALNVPIDRLMEGGPQLKDRIIEAATRLFDRLGFEETSLDIVAAAADVSRTEFDAHFRNKDELLYDVLNAYNNRTFSDLRRLPPKYGGVLDRLKHLLRLYYVHDLQHVKLTAAFHAYSWRWSATRERENARQLYDHHEMVLTILEEAARDGELQHGNFRAASEAIFAIYTYALRKAVFDSYDADKLVAHLEPQLALVIAGLQRDNEPTVMR